MTFFTKSGVVEFETEIHSQGELTDPTIVIEVRQVAEIYVPHSLEWYMDLKQAETLYQQLGAALNAHYVASSNKSADAVEVTA